jgi:hypothetical protein
LRVAVVRGEKLVAEAGGQFWNPEEGESPPLKAVTKQRLVKTEKTMRAVVTVIFGVCNSMSPSQLFVVKSSINPITNPNPVYSQSRDSMYWT